MFNDRFSATGNDGISTLHRRVAYLSMEPKTGLTNFLNQLDGSLLTHVILAFARVDPMSGSVSLFKPEHGDYLAQVGPFKQKFPHIRVLISVNNELASELTTGSSNNNNNNEIRSGSITGNGTGSGNVAAPTPQAASTASCANDLHHLHNLGHSINTGPFNKLAQSSQMRQKFARSAMEFLKCYSLDGIDIDWEFPNFPHHFGIAHDHERTGLTKILMELRSAIVEDFFDRQVSEQHKQQQINNNNNNHHNHHHSQSLRSSNGMHGLDAIDSNQTVKPHLLTLAIGAQETILRSSYELKSLANLCDWFNVMSYDYYMFKAYSPFTGPNSPLKPIVDPFVPVLGKLSFQSTLSRLLDDYQLDRDKIIMGIPTYARAYRLLFKNSHPTPFSLAYGSRSGSMSTEYLSYEEVCEMLAKPETIVDFDQRARVPYLLTDDGYTWVSYENEQSVGEKVQLIRENQLGGYMTWNLNSDFFRQKFDNNQNFPLHRALFFSASSSTLDHK